MNDIIIIIDNGFSLFMGLAFSLAFSGISLKEKSNHFAFLFLSFSGVHIILLALFDFDILNKIYPLVTHFPLIVILWKIYHRNFYISVLSVFFAYLFLHSEELDRRSCSLFLRFQHLCGKYCENTCNSSSTNFCFAICFSLCNRFPEAKQKSS